MEFQSQVLDTTVEFEGVTYTATYFVEHNIIHAEIAGRPVVTPLGGVPAAQTVQALLRAHLLKNVPKRSGDDE